MQERNKKWGDKKTIALWLAKNVGWLKNHPVKLGVLVATTSLIFWDFATFYPFIVLIAFQIRGILWEEWYKDKIWILEFQLDALKKHIDTHECSKD